MFLFLQNQNRANIHENQSFALCNFSFDSEFHLVLGNVHILGARSTQRGL